MRSLWRRLDSGREQHLAHGSRRYRDAETLELADDPFVSPVRVFPSETQDQLVERALERQPPWPPLRVCPTAAMSWRCQRSSVSSLNEKVAHAVWGSEGSPTSAALDQPESASAARPVGGGSPAHGGRRGSPVPSRDATLLSSHTTENRFRTTRYPNDQSKQPSLTGRAPSLASSTLRRAAEEFANPTGRGQRADPGDQALRVRERRRVWLSVTVEVPSGSCVRVPDLFADRAQGIRARPSVACQRDPDHARRLHRLADGRAKPENDTPTPRE
jgi:hypothetical protein